MKKKKEKRNKKRKKKEKNRSVKGPANNCAPTCTPKYNKMKKMRLLKEALHKFENIIKIKIKKNYI